jgi:hypothetical protein
VSDEIATFGGLAVLIALFFFTPRKVRGRPSYPASGCTKAIGAALLVALLAGFILQAVWDELGLSGR